MLAVFGIPRAHEGDALRAVRAACELSSDAAAHRAALATGEVVTGDPSRGRALVSGFPIDEADRLLTGARESEVRVADRTWRLVRHAASGRLQDGAWVLDRVDTEAPPLLRRLETPLVGREDELAGILGVLRRGLRERRPQLVTVFGVPGIGKTRLAVECSVRLADEVTTVVGRCSEYGEDATYAPLREALAPLAGGDERAWLERTLAESPKGRRSRRGRRPSSTRGPRSRSRRRPGPRVGCSRRSRDRGRCCSCSTTCSGRRRPCSTSWSPSSRSPPLRFSSSA